MACASGRGGPASSSGSEASGADSTAAQDIAVVVENDITPSEPLTIYLLTVGGERSFLGSVPPRSTRTLHYRTGDLSGERRLAAGGRSNRVRYISQPFDLVPKAVLHWRLPSNALTIGEGI
jgi:hypothetical protein